MRRSSLALGAILALSTVQGWTAQVQAAAQSSVQAAAQSSVQAVLTCDVLVVGGGLAGVATAYEALGAGKTVCLTELTDWVGGQVSSQGTSALDEAAGQRKRSFFPSGYLAFRNALLDHIDKPTPATAGSAKFAFFQN